MPTSFFYRWSWLNLKIGESLRARKESVAVWSTHVSAIPSRQPWGSLWPWGSSGSRPLKHKIRQSQKFCFHCSFDITNAAHMIRMWFDMNWTRSDTCLLYFGIRGQRHYTQNNIKEIKIFCLTLKTRHKLGWNTFNSAAAAPWCVKTPLTSYAREEG